MSVQLENTIEPLCPFVIGNEYTRSDVFPVVGIAEPSVGDSFTGYTLLPK